MIFAMLAVGEGLEQSRAVEMIVGAVQIVRPLNTALNALSQVSRYLVIGTGLSLVIAAVVGAFLARRELRREQARAGEEIPAATGGATR